jgi:UPF0271 protein
VAPLGRSTVTLNIDLGELPDEPEELYRIATVANVACGGHAGDEASMTRAVALARAGGCRIAAHPSYPDRAGFGRKTMAIAPDALGRSVESQCRALAELAGEITIVKPHGALYHDLSNNPELATAFLDGVERALGSVTIVGPPRSPLAARTQVIAEGFADRGYDGDALLPRGTPGALIEDPAAAARQALALVARGEVQTVCVHGDTPNAVAIARAVRDALVEAGALA